MTNIHRFLTYYFIISLLITANCTMAGQAHVHGKASLHMAIDGKTVTIILESPMESLVGFEHMPATLQEKKTVDNMISLLRHPEKWMILPESASCQPASSRLDSPVLEASKHTVMTRHNDLDGEFEFQCLHPDKIHSITVMLFDAAPTLHELAIEVLHDKGQTAGKLDTHKRTLMW